MDYRRTILDRYASIHASHVRWSRGRGDAARWMREYQANFATCLPRDPNALIVELGCGRGLFLAFLESMGRRNYIGVERSPEQIDVARQLVGGRLVHDDILAFLHGYDEGRWGPPQLFVLIQVLEHFCKDEVFEILRLIRTRLAQGGSVLVQVPNCGSPLVGAYSRYVDFTHEVGFTVESLRDVLMASGFDTVHAGPQAVSPGWKSGLLWAADRVLESLTGREVYLDACLFAVGRTSRR